MSVIVGILFVLGLMIYAVGPLLFTRSMLSAAVWWGSPLVALLVAKEVLRL